MTPSEREFHEEALAHARKLVAMHEAALGAAPVQRFAVDRLVPAKVIAKTLARSPETVRGWCRQYGLGVQIGGDWFIDTGRLTEHINRRATL